MEYFKVRGNVDCVRKNEKVLFKLFEGHTFLIEKITDKTEEDDIASENLNMLTGIKFDGKYTFHFEDVVSEREEFKFYEAHSELFHWPYVEFRSMNFKIIIRAPSEMLNEWFKDGLHSGVSFTLRIE